MKIKVIKRPFIEPIDTQSALDFLRVDDPYETGLVSSLITVAREWAEEYTGRKFINTKVRLSLGYVSDKVTLPYGDFYVDSIKSNGKDISPNDYEIDDDEIIFNKLFNKVVIEYTVGYGETITDVPESVKQAILMLVGALYEQRSDLTFNLNVKTSPLTSRYLLDQLRLY